MTLKNIVSFVSLSTIVAITAAVVLWQAPVVSAQTNPTTPNFCPIENEVSADFAGVTETYTVESEFFERIQISNFSSYTLAGVKVALAAFSSTNDTIPSFWTVLEDEYQLLPDSTIEVPVNLDLSAMPAGEYTLKVFTIQGDETAALGSVLHNAEATEGVVLVKSATKTNDVAVQVVVNEQNANDGRTINLDPGEAIDVKIETRNNNKLPLLGNSMFGVITEGEVPLGAAVRVDIIDPITLIPNGTASTEIMEPFVEGGELTVYAGSIDPTALRPLLVIPVKTDTEGGGSWAYVSQVGLSDYPLQTDSSVVACVKYIGVEQDVDRFLELLGVQFTLSPERGEVVSKKVTTEDIDTLNYFSFQPGLNTANFDLTVDFLQERYGANFFFAEGSETEVPERSENLLVVDIISSTYACIDSDDCQSPRPNETNNIVTVAPSDQPSFWFYAGIVIAALLLMYIMLGRLGREDSGTTNEASTDELQ